MLAIGDLVLASRAGHICSIMVTGAFVKAVQFLLLFHKPYAQ